MTVALQGEQGKPRPALVVQSDLFGELPAVTVLPITSTLVDAPLLRITVKPNLQNGLAKPSQIMVDKAQTPPRGKLGGVIGHLGLGPIRQLVSGWFGWFTRGAWRCC